MAAKIGSYKGSPTITLNPDAKWPFTFGVAKAQLILQELDAIRRFVQSQERHGDDFDKRVEDRMAEQAGINPYGPPE